MPVKIAIAEDNARLSEMLRARLAPFEELKISFIAPNGSELIQQLHRNPLIDVVIMDIHMPVMDGIAATRELNSRWPQIKVIMFTVFDDEENLFAAILAGATGYLLKDEASANILSAIQEAMEGGAPMSPAIARKALALIRSGKPKPAAPTYDLTQRETEIVEHLSKGLSYDQIAGNLHISTGTVRKHIENIYRKLQVTNKVEALSKLKRD
ncbi:MAG TPA: response regulator transcription factor [Bacteroidia bacterium]|nr:response regulator transcription factor [Bacteroidia bacterium]